MEIIQGLTNGTFPIAVVPSVTYSVYHIKLYISPELVCVLTVLFCPMVSTFIDFLIFDNSR